MSYQLFTVATQNNQVFLTDEMDESSVFALRLKSSTITNDILKQFLVAKLRDNLVEVSLPDKHHLVVTNLSDEQQIVFDMYVAMADRAEEVAMKQVVASTFEGLVQNLGGMGKP